MINDILRSESKEYDLIFFSIKCFLYKNRKSKKVAIRINPKKIGPSM